MAANSENINVNTNKVKKYTDENIIRTKEVAKLAKSSFAFSNELDKYANDFSTACIEVFH